MNKNLLIGTIIGVPISIAIDAGLLWGLCGAVSWLAGWTFIPLMWFLIPVMLIQLMVKTYKFHSLNQEVETYRTNQTQALFEIQQGIENFLMMNKVTVAEETVLREIAHRCYNDSPANDK